MSEVGPGRTTLAGRHKVRVMSPAPRTVQLAFNKSKPAARSAAERVRALIEAHATFAGGLDLPAPCENASLADVDLICVVGGDGTLLAAARCLLDTRIPILGVNAGRVGFMAAFDLEAFEERAPRLLDGSALPIRTVHALTATVASRDGATHAFEAMNEVVVTAGPPYRMISLAIKINGEPGPVVSGDGLIIATPLGSTAYNVSAGGPIVSPDAPVTVITPIAAHSLAFRPIVVSESDTVEITVLRGNAPDPTGTALVVDGQVEHTLEEGATCLRPTT